ncbi:sugar phosphate isomerase/epimerase [Candidatus Micrarchaeota archaeon]|nr:sugar phosphate isomerase/epimerase [Candidatus Micrarchaeota archaeon]
MFLGASLKPTEDIYGQVGLFASEGFDYVDLPFDYPMHAESFDASKLKDALAENGLKLHGQTPVMLPFGSPYPEVRENAVRIAIASAKALKEAGALSVGIHPDPAYFFLEDLFGWNRDSFAKVGKEAGSLLVETLYGPPFNSLENIQKITSLDMIVDVGHIHIGEKDYGSSLKDFLGSGKVKHFHLSDNSGLRDDHLPLGEGTINWEKVKRTLEEHNYSGGVTFECYRTGSEGIVDSKKFWEAL